MKIFILFPLLLLLPSLCAVMISGDLMGDGDLPTANLYSSGSGDPAPAYLSTSTDAIFGSYSLRVQAGTRINGGGTLGGIAKGMPALTAGKRYMFTYYAKSLTGPQSQYLSFQNGNGDSNSLSHGVTFTTQWAEYSYTTVLNVPKSTLYMWPTSAAGTVFLIDNIRIYEVSEDIPLGLEVNVPEPASVLLLGMAAILLLYRKK